MVEIPPRKSMSNNSSENGIMVSSPSADADDLSNGNHKTPTSNNKMPDRLAPPDVCHRHKKHLKRLVHRAHSKARGQDFGLFGTLVG